MKPTLVASTCLLALVFIAGRVRSTASLAASSSFAEEGSFRCTETVIAGGPRDFATIRHLVLRGTNFDIGKKLAEIARDRHGFKPPEDSGKAAPHALACAL